MSTRQWIRLGVELLIDLARGKLEKVDSASVNRLRFRDVEVQVKASRSAGPPCLLAPPGWRCTRMRGHSGPCAAEPVSGARLTRNRR